MNGNEALVIISNKDQAYKNLIEAREKLNYYKRFFKSLDEGLDMSYVRSTDDTYINFKTRVPDNATVTFDHVTYHGHIRLSLQKEIRRLKSEVKAYDKAFSMNQQKYDSIRKSISDEKLKKLQFLKGEVAKKQEEIDQLNAIIRTL